jgi:hypothetical protein
MALRTRAASACKSCKSAKLKCNDYRPCSRCVRNNNESCVTSGKCDDVILQGAIVLPGSLPPLQTMTAATDPVFVVGRNHFVEAAALPSLQKVTIHNDRSNAKRQCISDLVSSHILDSRYSNQPDGLQSGRKQFPLSEPTLLAARKTQQSLSTMMDDYDRPIQSVVPFLPTLWPAAAPTLPTLPTQLAPPSTFALGAHLPAPQGSFGIGVAPPTHAIDYARLQYQLLLLAGLTH